MPIANTVLVSLALLSLFLLTPRPARGQVSSTGTGTVSGMVTDTSGAVVPGANIFLVNVATSGTRTTTSNGKGQYVFAFVDPALYDIRVEKPGFNARVVSNQTVQIGTQLTVNAVLQVGAVATVVTVTSTTGAELQTLNATVGATLSGATLVNLPNTSRDASTLAVLQPGQNINGNTGGAASDQNTFQVDGGYATDDMSGDNNTYIASFSSDTAGGVGAYHSSGFNQAPSAVIPLPVSTIQEFKVSTANQTADFNGGAGSQMQIATKRGTNSFHGSAYEYYVDNNFGGANTWDNNSTGFKQPSSHFSRFGANGGGKIPHSNFLGGSWYMFGGYEGFRFPQSKSFEKNFPSPSLRAGLIKLNIGKGREEVVNLNPVATTDPATGISFPANTGTIVLPNGNKVAAACPAGACDPRSLGLNPAITQLWSTVPLPNDYTRGDASVPTGNAIYSSKALVANTAGYKGSIATPQTSNFGVARIDHDFAKNWHFNATYHYYKLTKTVADQWDVGGFFPGDTKGQYAAIRSKPQNPWLYTAGLTTEINPTLTNDFHFSYTRNWWAYADPSGVPNVAGYPAAFELGGETSSPLGPYNTNNQSVRTRYWDGHDYMYRDDVTWIRGNHLLQVGGMYLRARDTHQRNDNGEAINVYEQYIIGDGIGTDLAGLGISGLSSGGIFVPSGVHGGNATRYGNYYSMILGMVDSTQSLFTRGLGSQTSGLPLRPRTSCAIPGVPSTADCIASPSLLNSSILPTYNLYLTDSWHLRPSLTLNYGVGYTIEMPPYETNGGVQTVMVDQNNHILRAQQYLQNEEQAALKGLGYAPLLGFATVRNVQGHSKYPYDPFYGGITPRIGIAWNFRPNTVLRAGFATIFGRINGVNPILVPMLTPGLLQPATCGGPNLSGGCGGDPTNVFRVGVDGKNAPLAPPSANLPQPWFPGFNDVATGSGETVDPNYKPDRSDEFNVSIQHQFGPKILAEAGYIGRRITNEIQYYSLTNVPYMMTIAGQTFGNAWKNIMVATNYGTTNLSSIPVQPFFEAAIAGGPNPSNPNAYCFGFPSCTAAFVSNNIGNMNISDPFDSWAGVSNAGDWVFGRSFTSDPINSPFGASGQSPSILTTVSNGYGNYNAGYLQLTFADWRGLTMKTNFQYSNALGTGNVVQATSSYATPDPFNIRSSYGPQYYNEKFTFNLFLNYAEPFFASQKGVLGRVLGGWNISPLFVYGSGFPVQILAASEGPFGTCGSLGGCNPAGPVGNFENGVITTNLHYSGTLKTPGAGTNSTCGNSNVFNVFTNPDASCPLDALGGNGIFGDPVRSPILGLDGQIGGGGPVTGLPFFNLDLGITKKVNFNERYSASLYFDFTNVLNHMQPQDPCFILGDQPDWGVLGCGGNIQANSPRRLQLGVSLDW